MVARSAKCFVVFHTFFYVLCTSSADVDLASYPFIVNILRSINLVASNYSIAPTLIKWGHCAASRKELCKTVNCIIYSVQDHRMHLEKYVQN